MHASLTLLFMAASAVLGAAQPACSSPADSSGALVTTLGRDTVVLESYTRTASRIEGHIVVRVPGTVLMHYVVDLDPSGAAKHSLVDVMPLGTADVGARRVTIDFTHDSAFVDMDSVGHHHRSRVALASPAMPQLMTGFGSSYGLYDSPILYAAYPSLASAAIGDTVHVTTFDIASGSPRHRTFIKHSATRIDADYFGIAWNHVTLDGSGDVASIDASGTTERTQSSRTNFIDVAAEARLFADEDAAGKGLGVASPSEIERGTVGGAHVVVAYSSPRRRGRSILGNVVPYGEVWRTGANEATTLFSSAPLRIGDATIPMGTYTLWTLPKKDGTVELIVNSQHGQWGTDHDSTRDIAHIPMTVSRAAVAADDFAIGLASGKPDALRISWGTFVWSVPIAATK